MKILGVLIAILAIITGIEGYIQMRIHNGLKAKIQADLISSQNKAISKKALDTQNYLKKIPKTEEKIITKYKTIYSKDGSCEAKLKGIQDAMDLYFANTPML
ncbi:hypothetical protein [Helicobacter cappadocius]|uniref:Uncharacterized protein n=1 Tax=Helicobacter cappadocius TaxID=3063998 RepID=A0AA90T5R1_9HELI|nr:MULTISPECIES: hypothetical protein [unclassified Helicobacter]MDO7253892.1 hypothetical protein [Helicobacter sp. faydin-H75]MDP2539753.1 hypothetical protein [Helicobacter sp. faydin-H76]